MPVIRFLSDGKIYCYNDIYYIGRFYASNFYYLKSPDVYIGAHMWPSMPICMLFIVTHFGYTVVDYAIAYERQI